MKKLFFALAVLALAIMLLPMQAAKAEPNKGDTCPYCNNGKIDWAISGKQQHGMGCSNRNCEHYRLGDNLLWGDHIVGGSKCVNGYCDICGLWCNLSHSGGTATCMAKAVCEKCGEAYGEVDSSNHDLVHHDAQAATCTKAGWAAYDTCSRCEYTTYKEIPAKGHIEVVDPAVPATCTKTGLTEGAHCSVCNNVLVKQKKVAKIAHTEVIDAAVAATCIETGLTEGKHCSVCGKVLVKQKKVAKLAHTEVIDPPVAATCTETGLTEGKHCSVCGKVLVKQQKLPAEGHVIVVEPAVPAACGTPGWTEGKSCAVCGKVLQARREVPAKVHWYGAWQPAEGETHAAACIRCGKAAQVTCALMEAGDVKLCPLCGYCLGGASLAAVARATAQGAVPNGDLTVFASAPGAAACFLTVAFEVGGRLTQPQGAVTVTVPAEAIAGCDVYWMKDGAQAPVDCTVSGGQTILKLKFTGNEPAAIFRLVP